MTAIATTVRRLTLGRTKLCDIDFTGKKGCAADRLEVEVVQPMQSASSADVDSSRRYSRARYFTWIGHGSWYHFFAVGRPCDGAEPHPLAAGRSPGCGGNAGVSLDANARAIARTRCDAPATARARRGTRLAVEIGKIPMDCGLRSIQNGRRPRENSQSQRGHGDPSPGLVRAELPRFFFPLAGAHGPRARATRREEREL